MPSRFSSIDGIFEDKNGIAWIPDTAIEMKTRLLIACHTGRGGHRGEESSRNTLKKFFWWKTIEKDVNSFVS